MQYYILDGKNVIPCDGFDAWWKWSDIKGTNRSIVAKTEITTGVNVSTVFLGFNQNILGDRIIIFETLTFVVGGGEELVHYSTWDEAVAGHWKMVEKITDKIAIKLWIA